MTEHLNDEERPIVWDDLTPREQHGVLAVARNWNTASDLGRWIIKACLTIGAIGGAVSGWIVTYNFLHPGKS